MAAVLAVQGLPQANSISTNTCGISPVCHDVWQQLKLARHAVPGMPDQDSYTMPKGKNQA